MPIALTCPQCSGNLRVPDNFAAKNVKCPKCLAVFPFSQSEKPAAITAKAAPPAPARGRSSAADAVEELEEVEEVEEIEEVDEELEEVPRPRRRRNIRREPGDEAISTLIPYKNGSALAAYYCGVFAFIPLLGLILAPTAAVLGIRGLLNVRANPTAKGTGHAIAGIILCFLALLVQIAYIAVGYIMLFVK